MLGVQNTTMALHTKLLWLSYLALTFIGLLLHTMFFTSSAESSGFADQVSAHTPVTIGADIDVPDA